MSATDEKMMESLECPICKDFFTEPKQLICGHTFCGDCIEQLDKYPSFGRGGEDFSFGVHHVVHCPQCRETCIIPRAGLSTNYVVKEMVAKFREVDVSNVSAPVSDSETVPCHNCSRKTPTTELFLCKDCEIGNKQHFSCSLCILRHHKQHDVVVVTDLATKHERDEATAQIEQISNRAQNSVAQMKNALFLSLEVHFEHMYKQLNDKHQQFFQPLFNSLYDNQSNLLKHDLEEKLGKAKQMEEQFAKALSELEKISHETINGFNRVQSTVREIGQLHDLIDFGYGHTNFDEPSSSTSHHNGFGNRFSYDYETAENKRRMKRKPRRLNRTFTLSDSPNTEALILGTVVLD